MEQDTYTLLREFADSWFLLAMVIFFAGIVAFVFRPGSRKVHRDIADIPLRDDTQALVDGLNEQVIRDGGRIYLTKDSLTRPEHFRQMDGARIDAFNAVRDQWDPERQFKSALSVRLLGDRLS